MAFSQADLDALDKAIATGELLVRVDDKEIRYHSAADMLLRRQAIAAELSKSGSPNRVLARHMLANFADTDTP